MDADNVDVEDDEQFLVCLFLRLATFTTHSGAETRSSGIYSIVDHPEFAKKCNYLLLSVDTGKIITLK